MYFFHRVIVHDKPEWRNVSMREPIRRISRCSYFFPFFFWSIIPFIRSFCTRRKSPRQVLTNTCTVCLQLAVLWQLLKFRFFVFAVLIAPYGIAFPLIEKPSHRRNLKGNDSTLLISRTTTFFIPCPAFHEFLFPAVTQAFLETFIISAPTVQPVIVSFRTIHASFY